MAEYPTTSQRGTWAARQQIGYLMQQGVDFPDCLSLAAGLVDYGSLPGTMVLETIQELFAQPRQAQLALQYGTTAGSLSLRTRLIEYLAELEGSNPTDLGLSVDRCVITTGSQQFLDLTTQAVFNPGDLCLVAAPTYFVYLSTLEAAGVEVQAVDCDELGMIPAALQQKLEQLLAEGELPRLKMLYLVSYFDNPCGITMPEHRRREILQMLEDWSSRQQIYLLEDAAYRELWFSEPPPVSFYALDQSRERVILTQTFSKSLSPGLRTGWGILPEQLVKPFLDLKSVHDFGSPHLNQQLIERMLQTGRYQQHVADLRRLYREKAETLWQALEQQILPHAGMSAVRPEGGLYVWLKVPVEQHSSRFDGNLFRRAASEFQVMFVPGELFYADHAHPAAGCTMRLSFGVQPLDKLAEGISRLSQALQK